MVSHIAPIIVGPVFEMVLGEPSSHPALEPYHVEFIGGKPVCSIKWAIRAEVHTTPKLTAVSHGKKIDFGVGMDMFHAVETSILAAPTTQV